MFPWRNVSWSITNDGLWLLDDPGVIEEKIKDDKWTLEKRKHFLRWLGSKGFRFYKRWDRWSWILLEKRDKNSILCSSVIVSSSFHGISRSKWFIPITHLVTLSQVCFLPPSRRNSLKSQSSPPFTSFNKNRKSATDSSCECKKDSWWSYLCTWADNRGSYR